MFETRVNNLAFPSVHLSIVLISELLVGYYNFHDTLGPVLERNQGVLPLLLSVLVYFEAQVWPGRGLSLVCACLGRVPGSPVQTLEMGDHTAV